MKINDTHLKEVTENDFSNATELADYLTGLNIPFREAHEITGKLVLKCINENKLLKDVTLEEYQSLNNAITDEIYEVLKPESAVNRRSNLNGTSPESVKQQIEEGKKLIG